MNGNVFTIAGSQQVFGDSGGSDPVYTGPGPSPPPTLASVPTPLAENLRAELRRLVEAPDFLRHLPALGRLVASAEQLVNCLARLAPLSSPLGLAAPPTPTPVTGSDAVPSYGSNVDSYVGQMGPRSNPEQFGARAIRELVQLVPDAVARITQGIADAEASSPDKLVTALSAARAAGMDEIASKIQERLERVLGIETSPVPPVKVSE